MLGFKEREIIERGWSECYYDLHDHLFSMVQKGLVVLHADNIWLKNCKFAVQPAGREQVRKTGVKGVHAYVRGNYMDHDFDFGPNPIYYLERCGYRFAYYNPYEVETFIDWETREPIYEASSVVLINKKAFYKK